MIAVEVFTDNGGWVITFVVYVDNRKRVIAAEVSPDNGGRVAGSYKKVMNCSVLQAVAISYKGIHHVL